MVEILTPLSIWMQLANLFFMVSGLHGDLLIIRFSLFVAYSMLLCNSLLGSPLWPFTSGAGISVDGLIWSALSLYVHGSSLLALILDERKVQLTEDEAALWRMMYRTGGLSRRLFQSIVAQKLSVVEIPAGQTIDTENFFYIIYNGQIRLHVVERNIAKSTRLLVSGEMFDLKMIGFFSERSVFDKGSIRCKSVTTVKLFQIAKEDMKRMSHHPLAKGVWQSLLINNLSYVVESYLSEEQRSSEAELYCDKIFRPLESWEQPKPTLSGSGHALANPILHLVGYIQKSFSPPWPFEGHPTGIRQTQLPPPPQRAGPTAAQEPPRFHRFSIRRLTTKATSSSSGSSSNNINGSNNNNKLQNTMNDDTLADIPSRSSGQGAESSDMTMMEGGDVIA